MYSYCEVCSKAFVDPDHQTHRGSQNMREYAGIFINRDFVSEEEEQNICEDIYRTPFVDSQSGRRKQVSLLLVPDCLEPAEGTEAYTSVCSSILQFSIPYMSSLRILRGVSGFCTPSPPLYSLPPGGDEISGFSIESLDFSGFTCYFA